jgi:hypothetical protein
VVAAGGLTRPRAFGVPLCLRRQLLPHLQLVHLAEELLEQLATVRTDALFQLVREETCDGFYELNVRTIV